MITVMPYFQELFSFSLVMVNSTCIAANQIKQHLVDVTKDGKRRLACVANHDWLTLRLSYSKDCILQRCLIFQKISPVTVSGQRNTCFTWKNKRS